MFLTKQLLVPIHFNSMEKITMEINGDQKVFG